MLTNQRLLDAALAVGLVVALGTVLAIDYQKTAFVDQELAKGIETEEPGQKTVAAEQLPSLKHDSVKNVTKDEPVVAKGSTPATKVGPPVAKDEPAVTRVDPPVAKIDRPVTKNEPMVTKVDPLATKVDAPIAEDEPMVTKVVPPVAKDEPLVTKVDPPAEPALPAVEKVRPAEPVRNVVVKRRSESTEEDLRKQLLTVPETGFGQWSAAQICQLLTGNGSGRADLPPDIGPKQFKLLAASLKKPDNFALPWQKEPDCSLGKEPAERLHVLSRHLRDCLSKSVPTGDVRPDPKILKALLFHGDASTSFRRVQAQIDTDEWKKPQAIPTLMQLLQTENVPIRLLLVEILEGINGKEASTAIAQRAIFDLAAEVREKAAQTLARRPAPEYQQTLLDGLRYPWPAAADHAAEAIAAVRLTAVVPSLVDLLNAPAPNMPFQKQNETGYSVKEIVRINHLCNCVLCHSPSLAKDDLVRGRVPMPGEDPPPLYYNANSGVFVRANTTYLRQDFSVIQPVPDNGKWAANQRYDYVMRTRPAKPNEWKTLQDKAKTPEKYPQREAVLFALRELTNINAGDTYDAWAKELPELLNAPMETRK